MTLTSDVLSLLAACRLEPDDNALRLALADKLDEQDAPWVVCPKCKGKSVRCQKCKGKKRINAYHLQRMIACSACKDAVDGCSTCEGTGQVQDRSLAARAELIRVQAELQRWRGDGSRCPVCEWPIEGRGCSQDNCSFRPKDGSAAYRTWIPRQQKYQSLMRRESQLLRDNPQWLTKPCPECEGHTARSGTRHCPTCGGTGDLFKGWLRWFGGENYDQESEPTIHPFARLDRGLIRVNARPDRLWQSFGGTVEVRESESRMRYDYTSHPWLVAIAADSFVVGVDVEGVKPATSSTYSGVWFWPKPSLPEPVWELLRKETTYHTEADANRALSAALLTWATKGAKT